MISLYRLRSEILGTVKLDKCPKFDAYLLDRARYIRQNHWTMFYRSRPDVGQALR